MKRVFSASLLALLLAASVPHGALSRISTNASNGAPSPSPSPSPGAPATGFEAVPSPVPVPAASEAAPAMAPAPGPVSFRPYTKPGPAPVPAVGPAPGSSPASLPAPAPGPAPVPVAGASIPSGLQAPPSPAPFPEVFQAPAPMAPAPGPMVFGMPFVPANAPVPQPAVGPAPVATPVPAPAPAPGPAGPAPMVPPGSVEVVDVPSGMQAPPGDPLEECFEVPVGVCLEGTQGRTFVKQPSAKTDSLVLWYDFDKSLPVDESGYGHHLTNAGHGVLVPVPVGPDLLGQGASLALDGATYFQVADSQDFSTASFSISLWVYIMEDSTGSWRTLLLRGSSQDSYAPAILLAPAERRIHVRLGFVDAVTGKLDSTGAVPMRRWTHITVACGGDVLRLYVNGLQDTYTVLDGSWSGGSGPVQVGGDEWRAGVKAYVDDLRWYNKQLSEAEVKALAYSSLTGISADFVRLGCTSCAYSDAVQHCKDAGDHLCSVQELYEGGYHVARAMGWLSISPDVWHPKAANVDSEHFTGGRKLGLCCADP
mmetsp:Transcript_37313/g.84262  ORF Transcript_37313/g.84262 Transcript_37313/m.84262 type:complete len:538 (+) Transcript_37313:92-1705(+)